MATIYGQREIGPNQLTPDRYRFQWLTVESRRSLDVAESGGEAVDDVDVLQGNAKRIANGNDVRNQLPASHVQHRRRLSDCNCTTETRIKRYVIVEQLAGAGHLTGIQPQE